MPHRAGDESERRTLARQAAETMLHSDNTSRFLKMELEEVGPGFARVGMTVTEDMLNGVGICHGGMSYTLADTAFAYACNSHNRPAVALSNTVTYPAAARLGDRLTAECREVFRKGRNGTYDCTVTNQNGEVVVLFRGQCRVLEGHIVQGNAP